MQISTTENHAYVYREAIRLLKIKYAMHVEEKIEGNEDIKFIKFTIECDDIVFFHLGKLVAILEAFMQ
jgi:hypothetical protein